jgi:hypothetical protein
MGGMGSPGPARDPSALAATVPAGGKSTKIALSMERRIHVFFMDKK